MSDIKKLLESFSNIETTITEGKPIGHDYKFKDYLGATEPVRKQKPGVLATKKQTSKLVGDADGDGGATEESAQLEEDMVAQMAREFADFLNNKKPVLDNVFPSAEDRDLSSKPEDRTLTTEAEPVQQLAQQASTQPAITNIANQLSTLLGIDANQLRAAYRAPRPTAQQLAVLATAFKKLAAADPQVTVKAMTLLKKIAAEGDGR